MLKISKESLLKEAREKGYRPEILEKVYRLLDLLEQFKNITYLKDRLVLKGGTAINLFCSDQLPRLSVDIDFNYIGSPDLEIMRQERAQLEAIVLNTCQRLRYELHHNPKAHAGGKMILVYFSVLGNKGRLELDFNYIFRVPLWDPAERSSIIGLNPVPIIVLDIHELAAGKLHALLGREASRDLFDSHQLLTGWKLNFKKLRLAFTVYAGMERDDWQRISLDNIKFTVKDIRDKLIPVLRLDVSPSTSGRAIEEWAKKLVEECKMSFSNLLPFSTNEIEFLECLQRRGEIRPDLLTDDKEFCERVIKHPLLNWRTKKIIKTQMK